MSDLNRRAERFLSRLESLKENRGAMADIRRGFSRTSGYRAWPWIAAWCNLDNDRDRGITQYVAAAYATHPLNIADGNLGTVFRGIAFGSGAGKSALASFDSLFRRFLACHSALEVCRLLPGLIRAAKARGIPVNYRELYKNLYYWSGKGIERVRARWAREYWGRQEEPESAEGER